MSSSEGLSIGESHGLYQFHEPLRQRHTIHPYHPSPTTLQWHLNNDRSLTPSLTLTHLLYKCHYLYGQKHYAQALQHCQSALNLKRGKTHEIIDLMVRSWIHLDRAADALNLWLSHVKLVLFLY